jgi:hypothetical protein
MQKLVGDLVEGTPPGGYIGGLVDRLIDKAETAGPEERKQIEALVQQIRDEVDVVRNEFGSGSYKTAQKDRHALTRHVMGVVDLGGEALRLLGDNDTLLSMSQGCRDNLEGGPIVDVEHMTGAVIRDMGGQPSEELSKEQLETLNEQDQEKYRQLRQEDQTIFNVLLTGSGHIQQQQMVTGLSGSGSVREVYDQIGVDNPDVRQYVRGLEPQDRVTRL